MIEQSARIVRTEHDNVVIEVIRQTACGSCSSKAGCGKSLLDNVFRVKPLVLSIPNTLNAKENDDVVVGLNESAMLQVSFYLYLVPLISMLLFAIIAGLLLPNKISEVYSILFGVFGLVIGGMFSRYILYKKRESQSALYQPVLLKVNSKIASAEIACK